MKNKLISFVLFFILSGCSMYNVEFIPPKNGTKCIKRCNIINDECKNRCAYNNAMCSDTKNMLDNFANMIRLNGNDKIQKCNDKEEKCNRTCDDKYYSCYKSCGGKIIVTKK